MKATFWIDEDAVNISKLAYFKDLNKNVANRRKYEDERDSFTSKTFKNYEESGDKSNDSVLFFTKNIMY